MTRSWLCAVAILAAAVPGALIAQPGGNKMREAAQDDNLRQFEDFITHFYRGQFSAAKDAADRIVDPRNQEGTAIYLAVRAAARLGVKRRDDAVRLFAEAQKLAGMNPYPTRLQFEAGLLTDDMAMAAQGLDRLIARFPDVVRDLDQEFMWSFLQNAPKGEDRQNDDRRVALARLGYGGTDPVADYMALRAVGILFKRGDAPGVRELLPYIDEPRLVEDMLIQRRFAAFWPQIEAAAGPQLAKARAAAVLSAEQAYAKSPESFEKLHYYVAALRHAGKLDEAIALRPKIPASADALAKATEAVGWAFNEVALALHEAGRSDDADALYALLNDAPIASARWRVSMIINRLGLLVADGRFEKAAALLDVTEASARDDGSPYARQLVRRMRYCTLSRLGRQADAAKLLPDLLEHAEDAEGSTVDALLCGGEADRAEAVALEALKDDKNHAEFLRFLQAKPLTSDMVAAWQDSWTAFRQRPAIAAQFARLGRDLPEHLLPAKRSTVPTK